MQEVPRLLRVQFITDVKSFSELRGNLSDALTSMDSSTLSGLWEDANQAWVLCSDALQEVLVYIKNFVDLRQLLNIPGYISSFSASFVSFMLDAAVLLVTLAFSFFTTTIDMAFSLLLFFIVLYYTMVADKDIIRYVFNHLFAI